MNVFLFTTPAARFAGCLFLVGTTLLLAACSSEAPVPNLPEQDADEQAIVLAALDTLQTDLLRDAFDSLPSRARTWVTRTEQLAPDGAVLGSRTYRVRQDTQGDLQIISVDSSGAYDFGLFASMTDDEGAPEAYTNPLPEILPEDPAYASARNADAFLYRRLPDTTLAGQSVHRYEVQARPDTDQPIRRARFYVTPETQQLVALDLKRINPSFLFQEDSRFQVFATPNASGSWEPDFVDIRTAISLPTQRSRTFHLRTEFSDGPSL
jgi:hypothetical protein